MKLKVKNKKEYKEVLRTARYLHDFVVWDEKGNGYGLDFDKYPLLNQLAHMYEHDDNEEILKSLIEIENKESK